MRAIELTAIQAAIAFGGGVIALALLGMLSFGG
jgi:hypothetical protein